ncbi:unnamed protein product [Heligmosomoides polygyrus]|uniref:Cwf21 domain-containing protein n=1 Tax=Heligmosomoides polygyrus TaxID=6339 RepID=A0A183F3H5_HELPZ|nr:unnamed protein product [Heligmosomoides polygyrus]
MYNGIGLQTARGTGTNGYVQANLSNLLLSKKRVEYNSEADLRRSEAELNRAPNEDILQHQRKRVIEMKCAEFEMLMEEKNRDRMRNALGLSDDFVPGASMKNLKKSDIVGAALTEPVPSGGDSLLTTLKKEMKGKSAKDKVRHCIWSCLTVK